MSAGMMPPRAIWRDERAGALWTERHTAYLLARMDRAALFTAWDAACLGMRSEGRRLRKRDLAQDIARHDWRTLAESWCDDPFMREYVAASEARVREVGTPIRWAEMVVTGDGPCPLDEQGWHVWTEKVGECFRCGADMRTEAPTEYRVTTLPTGVGKSGLYA